jgi:hypothetical protein
VLCRTLIPSVGDVVHENEPKPTPIALTTLRER